MNVSVSQITWPRVLIALTILLVGDGLWFQYSVGRIYPKFTKVKIAWGLLAWLALAKAISAGEPESSHAAWYWGAAVGAITYAVFNGTEMAIRPDWTPVVGLSDWLWGITSCSLSSVGLYYFQHRNQS